jgi:hypothetical protein
LNFGKKVTLRFTVGQQESSALSVLRDSPLFSELSSHTTFLPTSSDAKAAAAEESSLEATSLISYARAKSPYERPINVISLKNLHK